MVYYAVVTEEWFEKDRIAAEKLPTVECSICYDDVPPCIVYTMSCDEAHRFCFECLEKYLATSINEGTIPTCAWSGCDHVFTELEVQQIFPESSPVPNKYSRLLLREGLMGLDNCVGCPTPGCDNWLVLPDQTTKVRCECEMCDKSFCSLCKKLYHYRSK
jgi:hypothetical protein